MIKLTLIATALILSGPVHAQDIKAAPPANDYSNPANIGPEPFAEFCGIHQIGTVGKVMEFHGLAKLRDKNG